MSYACSWCAAPMNEHGAYGFIRLDAGRTTTVARFCGAACLASWGAVAPAMTRLRYRRACPQCGGDAHRGDCLG